MTSLVWIRRILWVLVIATGALSGYLVYQKTGSQVSSVTFGAPFNLIDHHGNEISDEAFAGHPVALFFGFTHCPEVCPTTLFELADWIDQLGAEGDNLRAFFITVDPERDTPDVLGYYVSSASDRITGITGEPEKVRALADAWRVYYQRVELEDNDYTMDHTASIFLVNRDGTLKSTIAYLENPNTAIEKLRNLIKENS